MRIEFKDYHRILGVQQTATDVEIKKAFRKLARQFHPDVAQDKEEAEERFKLISEAYEVLTGREKRWKYCENSTGAYQDKDFRSSSEWQSDRRSSTGTMGSDGEAAHAQWTDSRWSFDTSSSSRNERSDRFSSRNTSTKETEIEMLVTLDEVMWGSERPMVLFQTVACEQCLRSGRLDWRTCPACNGAGTTLRTKTYRVKIPTGVRDGQRFWFKVAHSNGVDPAPNGDFTLRIRLAPHPIFRVENDALHCDLHIDAWVVAFGGSVSVPTPDGAMQISVPAGLRDHQRLRVRGRGLPGTDGSRGDLIAVVRTQRAEPAQANR